MVTTNQVSPASNFVSAVADSLWQNKYKIILLAGLLAAGVCAGANVGTFANLGDVTRIGISVIGCSIPTIYAASKLYDVYSERQKQKNGGMMIMTSGSAVSHHKNEAGNHSHAFDDYVPGQIL